MKKALLIIVAGVIFLFSGCDAVMTTTRPSTVLITNTPPRSDFEFIFKYGVGAKNVINTYRGKFTKDMIMDPSITIDLKLTDDEMDRIYQKMIEIDFFNYPDLFSVPASANGTITMVTPYSSYYFTVVKSGVTKKLKWDDSRKNINEKADRLRVLINLIQEIIALHDEYRKLPPPRGGYL